MIPINSSSRKSTPYALLLAGALFLLNQSGCSGDDNTPLNTNADLAESPAPDLLTPAPHHNIHVTVTLKADPQGVGVFAQNGVFAYIPKANIIGKGTVWTILKGGDQIANGKMLEVGNGVIDDNLQSDFTTKLGYPDGPWELALVIMLTSTDPTKIPQPGDLAGFSFAKPPAGEPPITGTSVRVSLHGADANVTLVNSNFIKI